MTNDLDAAALAALPEYVRGLLEPSAYPVAPADVRLVQTHISYVFLAGDVVYKTKKPVDFGFIEQLTNSPQQAFKGNNSHILIFHDPSYILMPLERLIRFITMC